MTHERSPFDSAEDKAEWEETHFGEPDEDALYEEDRQRRIDEQVRKHDAAFDRWFSINIPVEQAEMDSVVVSLMQSAFFGGAQYGADEMERIYREVSDGLGQAQAG